MADPLPRTVGASRTRARPAAVPGRPCAVLTIGAWLRAEAIYEDYTKRRMGILKALTEGDRSGRASGGPPARPQLFGI